MNLKFDSLKLSLPGADYGVLRAEELQLIPRGTFAGTIYELGLIRDDRVVSANTGEQGGGQN